MKKFLGLILILLLTSSAIIGCSSANKEVHNEQKANKVGILQFKANGEDIVRFGFKSKDGWNITFDHVYVTIANVSGFQTEPPYDAEKGEKVNAKEKASLPDTYTVDLAQGEKNAEPILVGEVKDASVGHYNAISWEVVSANEGPAKGYSLVMTGKAEKDGKILDFTISNQNEYRFTGGEYVGDVRKGIVNEGVTADLEMTFHFDHIFGDTEAPAEGDLNLGALGFEPFAELAKAGEINIAVQKDKLSKEDYEKWMNILPSLGHVGEGHCYHEEI